MHITTAWSITSSGRLQAHLSFTLVEGCWAVFGSFGGVLVKLCFWVTFEQLRAVICVATLPGASDSSWCKRFGLNQLFQNVTSILAPVGNKEIVCGDSTSVIQVQLAIWRRMCNDCSTNNVNFGTVATLCFCKKDCVPGSRFRFCSCFRCLKISGWNASYSPVKQCSKMLAWSTFCFRSNAVMTTFDWV